MEERGFTLLEILLAIFILTLVVSAVFGAFRGTFKVVDETEAQEQIYAVARITLERISEDLACVYERDPLGEKTQAADANATPPVFRGEDFELDDNSADTLCFLSWAHLSFKSGRPAEGPAEIRYTPRYNEETGELSLYRSDTLDYLKTPDAAPPGLLLCRGLKWIDFVYYDEAGETHKTWNAAERQGQSLLPRWVEISIGFENPLDSENPLQFLTGVALPPVL